ncbi:BMP family protein [Brucella pituitosa]|uniref:putative B6 ABC transporter substrate-binding protein n=1 Tax=Brucella TaxID=234 RepID=UPI0004669D3A|nr:MULTISPECIES: BMP family protein [Brucella]PQZ50765.1 BMP family ABC transporter substrate-binding protein [Ochrobactrum sp. MYb19]PRA52087.1 BMP family ABC transporter substrate-binding protein [Ochrobactrum sp. MYb68]PRA68805.1 BMP family ABC transporter substrate-binding protein [Ochrobactrum sp. MYb18]PRA73967.1 BMP family ABC transporter substrate-binding protein [Brucella thiophenivorans]PRA84909.1 BMP family ABC transporter substrate-binding protein [Ochrobactrum sp. MYb29]PRA91057.
MRKKITGTVSGAVLALALSGWMASSALAGEITSIAILAPEMGTDMGWNQQGVDAAKAAGEAAGVKVVVAENLGYGDVRPTLRELAEDGAGLLIAHASGYNTAAPEIGAEMNIPVAIVDSPDKLAEGKIADYTAAGSDGAYLAGRLAAKMSRTKVVGIVVSGEPPSWNNMSVAFAQGVKAENPAVEVRYAVIGPAAYADAAGGKRVAETVIASGADIIFGQGNGSSFGMLQAVETTPATDGGKAYFIDVIGDKTSIDKGNLLSSVIWDLTPVYVDMIKDLKDGKYGSRNYNIKLSDGSLRLLKTKNIPDDVWKEMEALQAEVVSGAIKVEPKFDADSVHALVKTVASK